MIQMTKTELVAKIAKETGVSLSQVNKVVGAFLSSVTEAVAADDSVALIGFGVFSKHSRKARKGLNPRTHKVIKIKACNAPHFKPGSRFKQAVNS